MKLQLTTGKKFILILLIIHSSLLIAQTPSLEWVRRYPDTINQSGSALAMVLDDSGNVYVTGLFSINLPNQMFYCTIKYNSSGVRQWVKTFNTIPSGWIARAISLDRGSNLYVTGSGVQSTNNTDYGTIKYNLNGDLQWVKFYNGPGNSADWATTIAIDSADNIYVAGNSSPGGNALQYATVKYSTEGNELWVRRYGTGSSATSVKGIVIDDSCNVYVTGEDYPGAVTIKYDSSGNQKWVQVYSGIVIGLRTGANAITLDRNNNVFITGYSAGLNTFRDYFTIKYSSAGVQQWVKRYSTDSTRLTNNSANSVLSDSIGNIYVSGTVDSVNSGHRYFCTIKYSNSGEQLWVRVHSFGFSDNQTALELDRNSNVYVTGSSADSNYSRSHYGIIKYDSSGTLKWEVVYSGQNNTDEAPRSIKADKNGNVFLTGFSGSDMCTLKYSQILGIHTISSNIPKSFRLYQNYPNPFNPLTTIKFDVTSLNKPYSIVSLEIYDILGRKVALLVHEKLNSGSYEISWNANEFSSGVYFYQLSSEQFVETKKLVLLK